MRHPLYVGEIVTVLGITLRGSGSVPLALWALLVVLQGYRAVAEESLLRDAQPGYEDYRRRTARFCPAVF